MQTYSFFGKQRRSARRCMKALMAKYPDIKGPDDVTPAGRRGQRLRRACMLMALAIRRPARPTATRCATASTRSASYDGLIKTYDKPFARNQARRAEPRTTTSGAQIQRQPDRAGRRASIALRSSSRAAAIPSSSCHAVSSALITGLGARQHVRAARARLPRHLRRVEHGQLRAGQLDDAGRGARASRSCVTLRLAARARPSCWRSLVCAL